MVGKGALLNVTSVTPQPQGKLTQRCRAVMLSRLCLQSIILPKEIL